MQKECSNAVRSAKRRHEKKISKDSNKHAFNSYINRKLNCKSGIGSSDGMRIGGNKEIAEALNSYFCSVYNKIDQADPPDIPMKNFHAKLDSAVFTSKEVSEKLSGLKISVWNIQSSLEDFQL